MEVLQGKNALEPVKLFNANGGDSFEDQAIIGGNSTGIANKNNVRYNWVQPLYRKMIGNFWIPQKVSLVEDKVTFKMLDPAEERAVRLTLSFLIFLDNFQVANLPNVAEYITCPAIRDLLTVQAFQEVIHSETYQYILEALYPSMERDEIYNLWRDVPILKKRIEFIANIAERFKADPSKENFIDVVIANFVLEGLYFYQGFDFFHNLAHRKKLVQTDKEITYIQTDENTHLAIFINILKELGVKDFASRVYEMMDEAVSHEIEWSHFVYGDSILGISKTSSTARVQVLANKRLKNLGLEPLYPDAVDPYKHIEDSQSVSGARGNFFEAGAITSYDTADSVTGWEDL